MKKIISHLFLFVLGFSFAQKVNVKIKNEIVQNIKQINKLYYSNNVDKNHMLEKYFTEKIFCANCEDQIVDLLNPEVKRNDFLNNNLKEVIGLLNVNEIKKSNIYFDKESNRYSLSYSTAEPNEKTGFEGASALIYIDKIDEKYKISGLMTIP